jgi:16S rRNA (cytosine967-C5)-methyltransferase
LKLHRLLVEAVIVALTDIFKKNLYADRVVERTLLSNSKWGARDRAFIAETIYNCVRNMRLYHYLHTGDDKFLPEDFTRKNFEDIVGIALILRGADTQNFPEFSDLRKDVLEKSVSRLVGESASRSQDDTNRFKILYSMPDWLFEIGEKELGTNIFEKEMMALNRPTDLVIRCNTLKIGISDLQKKLSDLGWQSHTTLLTPDALVLEKRGNITATDLFKTGFFEIQDAGSQLIAPFLKVEPGMFVVDACAGAGGKSLHLATLMQNTGKIMSMDTEVRKLEELKKRAVRNGITNIRISDASNALLPKSETRNPKSADRLLLDVPCSGLGVLRRHPDTKWKLSPQFLNDIRNTQQNILKKYSEMLKAGGKMVYATCSILPSENQDQVRIFLENNPQFQLEDERTVSPADDGFDGFYMARINRSDNF